MGEGEPLSLGEEPHRVVSDHVPTADRMNANLPRRALPGGTRAAVDRDELLAPSGRRRGLEGLSGAARGILLLAVVDLDDLPDPPLGGPLPPVAPRSRRTATPTEKFGAHNTGARAA